MVCNGIIYGEANDGGRNGKTVLQEKQMVEGFLVDRETRVLGRWDGFMWPEVLSMVWRIVEVEEGQRRLEISMIGDDKGAKEGKEKISLHSEVRAEMTAKARDKVRE